MTLIETITANIKDAMKAKEPIKLTTLRGLKNVVDLTAKEKKADLTDAEIVAVIRKEIKKREDTLSLIGGNRYNSLADREEQEKAILEAYLPTQIDDAALKAIISGCITELGATTRKDMGKVIKAVKEKTNGAADGAVISKLVGEVLK